MTSYATQQLESYRFTQLAVDVACFVCGSDGAYERERCRHCSAPLALSLQAAEQKSPPQLISVLGAANAGKTVFLGLLLDMLSRQPDQLQILARGAFSVSLQQATMQRMREGRFPDPTNTEPEHWSWAHCQVKFANRRRTKELVIPDIAGSTTTEEIEYPGTSPVLANLFTKSTGGLLLLDASQLEASDSSVDYWAMKAVTYLAELKAPRRRGWDRRPLAIVFTKADRSDVCRDNPRLFAEKRAPGLVKQCEQRLRCFEFFAASAVGASAVQRGLQSSIHIPLRVEPYGFVEPFAWLADF